MEEVTLAQILRDRWHSADWKRSVTSEEGMLCGDALVWTSDFMCNVEGDYTTNPRSSCEAKWRTEWYRLHFSTQLPTGAEIRRAGPRYTLKVWGWASFSAVPHCVRKVKTGQKQKNLPLRLTFFLLNLICNSRGFGWKILVWLGVMACTDPGTWEVEEELWVWGLLQSQSEISSPVNK